jgi:hypothetical protein
VKLFLKRHKVHDRHGRSGCVCEGLIEGCELSAVRRGPVWLGRVCVNPGGARLHARQPAAKARRVCIIRGCCLRCVHAPSERKRRWCPPGSRVSILSFVYQLLPRDILTTANMCVFVHAPRYWIASVRVTLCVTRVVSRASRLHGWTSPVQGWP